MIELTNAEKRIIRYCKGHDQTTYPFKGDWVESIKPIFVEIYGWGSDDNEYDDYRTTLFKKLLDIYLLIAEDFSGNNSQLNRLFMVSFTKTFSRESDLPIDRVINELCGLIQCNTVLKEGGERYLLY